LEIFKDRKFTQYRLEYKRIKKGLMQDLLTGKKRVNLFN